MKIAAHAYLVYPNASVSCFHQGYDMTVSNDGNGSNDDDDDIRVLPS